EDCDNRRGPAHGAAAHTASHTVRPGRGQSSGSALEERVSAGAPPDARAGLARLDARTDREISAEDRVKNAPWGNRPDLRRAGGPRAPAIRRRIGGCSTQGLPGPRRPAYIWIEPATVPESAPRARVPRRTWGRRASG